MSKYVWLITQDYFPESWSPSRIGLTGPRAATPEQIEGIKDGVDGSFEEFKMFDDDKNLYFEGRISGDYEGFEPLDDFGMPDSGCTSIWYRQGDGSWEPL